MLLGKIEILHYNAKRVQNVFMVSLIGTYTSCRGNVNGIQLSMQSSMASV